MAGRSMIDAGFLSARHGGGAISADPEVLGSKIAAASESLERRLGVRFLSSAHDAYHSGDLAVAGGGVCQSEIYLAEPSTGRATLGVTAVESVTEDGVALGIIRLGTPATWATGEVAVVYDRRGVVRRGYVDGTALTFKAWSSGLANIRTKYTAGWSLTEMPADIADVCAALAWLLYKDDDRLGQTTVSEAGVSVGFDRALSIDMRKTLKLWNSTARPRTLEA